MAESDSERKERIKRSVDSLQRIYAVVVALAIGRSIQALLLDPQGGSLAAWNVILPRTWSFVAFAATVVPFFHGMNRHLDRTYVEPVKPAKTDGALLFYFFVFVFESGLLYAAATSIGEQMTTFILLGALLGVDMMWAIVTGWIQRTEVTPSVKGWAGVNLFALALGLLVGGTNAAMQDWKPGLLATIAVVRSVADYYFLWEIYFGPKEAAPAALAHDKSA